MFEGINFGIMDIVIIVFLVLSVFWGLITGFNKKKLTSFATEVGFVVTYFFGSPLSHFIAQTDLSYHIQNAYHGLLPTTEAFTAASVYTTDVTAGKNQIATALNEMNIPGLFHGFVINNIQDASGSVGDAIASSFASLTIIAVVYIVLFLVTFILVKAILSPLWKEGSLFGEDGKTLMGRIAGVIARVAKSTITLITAMIVLTLVAQITAHFGFTGIQDFIDQDLNVADANGFSIARLFYSTASNLFQWISTNTAAITGA
jgi:uncharacterized membrane protein required for colicin V production